MDVGVEVGMCYYNYINCIWKHENKQGSLGVT